MSKLKTPVRYEPALDELNVGQRLKVSDEVGLVLPVPILNLNPASKVCPPIGKLLQCNNLGAVLHTNSSGFGHVQKRNSFLETGDEDDSNGFVAEIQAVLIEFQSGDGDYDYYLCNSTYDIMYKQLPQSGFMYIPVKATRLYFHAAGIGGWEVIFNQYGFYK